MAKIDFKEFVVKFKELYDSKDIDVKLNQDGTGFFLIRNTQTKIKDWILGEKKLDITEVQNEVAYKIDVLISVMVSILLDENFIHKVDKELMKENIEDIFKIVEQNFIDEDLRQKFVFENTAKNRILKYLTWEISNKVYDRNFKDSISGLKTCLLNFLIEDKRTIENLSEETITMELRKRDVENLIEDLEKIKELLK